MSFNKAYTLIEVIFVIVIISILSSFVLINYNDIIFSANELKARDKIDSIRSAIALQRTKNILLNINAPNYYPLSLDNSKNYMQIGEKLFFYNESNESNLLDYPTLSSNRIGGWLKVDENRYSLRLSNDISIIFTYNPITGSFDCDHDKSECRMIFNE